ncbi:hypothetical protein RF11_09002 [Thelohanellus kitauei]|uniref:Uncharacterized protein n=1 Tax=Thelohanellus kitauei TaxID=669202 RepID=A0A0C2M710_THEKT|nr:hypothetical protein RF11_09002 [Thelohanellus kitauei]
MSTVMCHLANIVSKLSSTPAFESFNSSKDMFPCNLSRKRKSKLLYLFGRETFEDLGKTRPGLETDLSYYEITKLLSDFSDNVVHLIFARIEFSRCFLKPDQSYKEWVAELRSIGKRCQFQCRKEDCKCYLIDDNIRDWIILRTPHKNIQSDFLQQTNLTLYKLVSILESMVLTSKTMQAIDRADDAFSIHKQSKGKNDENCLVRHSRRGCPHYSKRCNQCGNIRHIQEVCLMTNVEVKPSQKLPLRSKDWRVNELPINLCYVINIPVIICGRDRFSG